MLKPDVELAERIGRQDFLVQRSVHEVAAIVIDVVFDFFLHGNYFGGAFRQKHKNTKLPTATQGTPRLVIPALVFYFCKKNDVKFSLDLVYETPAAWADQVMEDFDSFLQDHADCERKASSMAMSFVAKCPDKVEIIPELIETALEELEHFQMVYKLMESRGVRLPARMPKDLYIEKLMAQCRSSVEERLMDRMLLASIIECRGAERFRLIAEAATDEEIQKFYKKLWTSEAKHGHIFVKFALNYWPREAVYDRLRILNEKEGQICAATPWRPALH